MKTIKKIEDVLRDGNSSINQRIKGDFIGKHVYCNVNTLVEYCLSKGHEDSDSPIQYEEIENLYSYPEYYGTFAKFEGGSDEDRQEEIERLKEEMQAFEETESLNNAEKINEEIQELEDLESEPAEIFEWWAVSSYLYEQLKRRGYPVVDAGSCYVWGRTTTGQAILLDHVITVICADMGILEGQENEW